MRTALHVSILALASLWLVAGCSSSRTPSDAGGGDGGRTLDSGPRPDAGAVADAGDTEDAGRADDAGPRPDAGAHLCGDATCGSGEICITGRCAGCCDLPPECIPIPAGCSGALGCGCFTADPCGGCTTCQTVTADEIVCGNCMCKCAAPWTPIDTPSGPRPIVELREGDLVYSLHHGEVVTVPIARTVHRPVTGHAVAHIALENGATLDVSGSHPTADGRRLDALAPGDALGRERILSIETIPYDEPFTYDILPASDSGAYFVAGAPIGSTLHGSLGAACADCR